MTLRVIDTGERPARWNVAMTAALTALHRGGRVGDTLRLHRYPAAVLIGRNQILAQVVHVERCRAAGIELARRVSGGGAVYMAPGALAWDVAIARRRVGIVQERAAGLVGEAVAAALRQFGLPARYSAPQGVAVASRKICGLSGYADGGTLVCQGTMLIDTDLAEMPRFLRLPPHGAPPLTTVTAELGRAPPPGALEAALAAALAQALGRSPHHQSAETAELRLADDWHAREFGCDGFVETAEPEPDLARGQV